MKITLEQAFAALRGLNQLKAATEYDLAKAILDLKRALRPHVEPIEAALKAIEDEYMQEVLRHQKEAKANPDSPLGIPLDVEVKRQASLRELDAKARLTVIEIDDELCIPGQCVAENKVTPQTVEDLDPVIAWNRVLKKMG